eukprot:3029454-Ditylum_brightwellii.AAC.1
MTPPMLDLIKYNYVLVELLSFLDFKIAFSTGQTCHRLKMTSNRVLDGWVNKVLSMLPCEVGSDTNFGTLSSKGILRQGKVDIREPPEDFDGEDWNIRIQLCKGTILARVASFVAQTIYWLKHNPSKGERMLPQHDNTKLGYHLSAYTWIHFKQESITGFDW